MIPFSILDLSPVAHGSTIADAFHNSRDLAQHAERWGYQRYWLAEHHGMSGIASAATSLVISHVAAGTDTIRVGAGGIMLPNHAPLIIAEQFGTLEALYPGRVDLGIGRAPGTDQKTARALRRNLAGGVDTFADDVQELQAYFDEPQPGQVKAVPGASLHVPIWLLGSSLYSAQLAAQLGLPFAFASHFAPDYLLQAARIYREYFRPSAALQHPHLMVGCGVYAATTDAEAKRLFSSAQMQFLNLLRGAPGQLSPPIDDFDAITSPQERAHIAHTMTYNFVGTPANVADKLQEFLRITGANELIVTSQMYDHAARLRSFELLSNVRDTAINI
jgi:luciferase family oxidoreductase group 1